MAQTHVHPIPSTTTLVEDVKEVRYNIAVLYERYRGVVATAVVLGLSVLAQRALMRRELKRLDFIVDVYDYDDQDLAEVDNPYSDD